MSLSAKLAEYHPVVIEGMGGYDTRDPNVIADHLTQRLKAHWAVKPPRKPLVVLTQGDPLEPSGISAITPLVAKQLNAPRALAPSLTIFKLINTVVGTYTHRCALE